MMKRFDTYQTVDGFKPCMKRQIVVGAMPMAEPFEVKIMEGVMRGKTGDYFMRGVDGELYPCEKYKFEKIYHFLGEMVGP
jgi:hypothetical protein